ncbi:IclR family transcriptional regulator [Striga asiatica]|uniref:IclR family transcriptional regulator n=1 Tax=Striga asiatica TaxID=4170 RepID=A0A5A7QGF7_STRAF|nr:IclR family transcriptional regulator [Striga asiatica]
MEGVGDVLRKAWNQQQEGTPMFRVHEKIKTTKLELLNWNRGIPRGRPHGRGSVVRAAELLNEGGRSWNKELLDDVFEAPEFINLVLSLGLMVLWCSGVGLACFKPESEAGEALRVHQDWEKSGEVPHLT